MEVNKHFLSVHHGSITLFHFFFVWVVLKTRTRIFNTIGLDSVCLYLSHHSQSSSVERQCDRRDGAVLFTGNVGAVVVFSRVVSVVVAMLMRIFVTPFAVFDHRCSCRGGIFQCVDVVLYSSRPPRRLFCVVEIPQNTWQKPPSCHFAFEFLLVKNCPSTKLKIRRFHYRGTQSQLSESNL